MNVNWKAIGLIGLSIASGILSSIVNKENINKAVDEKFKELEVEAEDVSEDEEA